MVVAVDSSRCLDQEAMKVAIDAAGFISDFGKSMLLSKAQAESIGVEKLDAHCSQAVLSRIAELMEHGVTDRYYEDVYTELIHSAQLTAKAVDIAGLNWAEIDTVEDLHFARQWIESRPRAQLV